MRTSKLTAKDLLGYLADAADVLADEAAPGDPDPLRCAALADRVRRLIAENARELEAALEVARANGLLAERAPDCPRCGFVTEADPSDPSVRYCGSCGREVSR